jgi:hypothetical protein
MTEVHPGEHDALQRQQHGGADDPQPDPSHGASLDQAANATLTRQPATLRRTASPDEGRPDTADGRCEAVPSGTSAGLPP